MIPAQHRRVVLARRPVGLPTPADFRLETVPTPRPGPGQVLVRVLYLSLDPYMRGRMRDVASYAPPIGIGDTIVGGTVGEVVASEHAGFKVGDIVEERLGWQEYGLSNGAGMRRIDPALAPISTANGILGMPGLTAWFGLYEIGRPKPGETVVVSAAAGAVGQVVGQLARLSGAHVVGIAGGAAKCAFLTETLGFHAALDYKAEADLAAALRRAAPDGVDVYFDNVGGPITDTVHAAMNTWGRVALCGAISQYNDESITMGPRLPAFFVGRRVTMQGFIVSDYATKFDAGRKALGALVRAGRLVFREDIVDGLENAPAAFIGLLKGDNFGKLQIRVATA
jgi:hypothetical protein